jgi:hypothetical protein
MSIRLSSAAVQDQVEYQAAVRHEGRVVPLFDASCRELSTPAPGQQCWSGTKDWRLGLTTRVPGTAFIASSFPRRNWNFEAEPVPALNGWSFAKDRMGPAELLALVIKVLKLIAPLALSLLAGTAPDACARGHGHTRS